MISIDVNDNPQSPSYPALSFMSRKILPGQGGSPFSVPVTWYGRPLGSAFPSPISPKDIDQYHLSGSVNIELDNQANLELSVTKSKHKNFHNRPDTINSRMELAIAGKGGANGNETWNLFNPLLNSSSLIEYIKGSEQSLKIGDWNIHLNYTNINTATSINGMVYVGTQSGLFLYDSDENKKTSNNIKLHIKNQNLKYGAYFLG